ncbi:helix-turn-helix domain-containing protein [Thiolapillus sp.]|uniref:AraC family transcriptional regulator n=1 Tax=Thiolapillus sp. TaxID=2017437 RepID=UPI003AF917B4
MASLLEQRGAPTDKYLTQAHIPLGLREQPDAVISVKSLMTFLEAAIEDTDWQLLGYEAGGTPLHSHGPIGPYILSATTLYQAAQRLVISARRETSITDNHLAFEGGTAWICMTPLLGTSDQKQQVELYNLHILLQLARSALGTNWRPERVRLCATAEATLKTHPELEQLNIEFGATTTAIAIPMEQLAAPIHKDDMHLLNASGAPLLDDGMITLDTMNALRQLIETYLPYNPTLETLSRLTGISKRSLQRFLHSRGTSFSRLVEQVIFCRAIELMADPGLRLREIAQAVGYSELSHFSRAFHRMTGLPPSTYRSKTLQLVQKPDPHDKAAVQQ